MYKGKSIQAPLLSLLHSKLFLLNWKIYFESVLCLKSGIGQHNAIGKHFKETNAQEKGKVHKKNLPYRTGGNGVGE